MESRVIYTKEQLSGALHDKVAKIIIKGEIAETVNTALKIGEIPKRALVALKTALAGFRFTGGMTAVAAAPIAALTGLEIIAIIAVSALGVALILEILKNYRKTNFKGRTGDTEIELELERD